jgi:hypothetical protein
VTNEQADLPTRIHSNAQSESGGRDEQGGGLKHDAGDRQ